MKNKIFSLVLIGMLFGLSSCDDDSVDLTFTVDAPQTLTTPADGASFVFLEAEEMDSLEFEWTAAQFTPKDVQNPNYRLQMDFAGNDFKSPKLVSSTTTLGYKTTVGAFNALLVDMVGLAGMDTTLNLEMRVIGNFDGIPVDTFFSNVNSVAITLYKAFVPPPSDNFRYILGPATSAGWDNALGLQMNETDPNVFEITTELIGGEVWKIIETLGMWAPQWGWDETGTWEAGGLSARPTEDITDPMPIPGPDMTGSYKVTIDLNALTYTIVPDGDIWLLGDATAAGWDNAAGIPFTKVDDEGKYRIDAMLTSGGFWKFLSVPGMWAPQWGTDDTGTAESGPLVFRPTEDVPDPAAIPAPAMDGLYRIEVDTTLATYIVTPL